jgi:hypothetical protein
LFLFSAPSTIKPRIPLMFREWPDQIDITAIGIFIAVVIGLPLLGHWLMILDIRAYMRALRGALVRITHVFPGLPNWARYQTPGCLRSLGLKLPCTEEDVKTAYRNLAEKHHPDRGGDRQIFLRLQRQFERSIEFLQDLEES